MRFDELVVTEIYASYLAGNRAARSVPWLFASAGAERPVRRAGRRNAPQSPKAAHH
ncbi:MAG TPA: hypothetical protein VHC69_09915 [Polyangiaceae bacterium]|nr:hypothetical protein [Polyangiaceae bacterium]